MKGCLKIILQIVCLCTIFSTGCSRQEKEQEKQVEIKEPKLVYEAENIGYMTAGADKDIYIGMWNQEGEIIHLSKEGKAETLASVFGKDEHGTNSITAMYFDGKNTLYIAADKGGGMTGCASIYTLDVHSKKLSQMETYQQYHGITCMSMLHGELVMLAKSDEKQSKQPVLRDAMDIFTYQGEVLISQRGKVIFDEFPILFAPIGEEEMLLYAHADNKGYYYSEATYDGKRLHLKEPDYQNLGQLTAMAFTGDDTFIYIATSYDNKGLMEINRTEHTKAEILSNRGNAYGAGDIVNADGVVYYVDKKGIRKFVYSEYKKKNRTLQVIESEQIGMLNAPYGCGYQMNVEKLSNDEMSLKVLSQDSDFDLCFMQSDDSFGYQVKEKGSFYPLSDIKEVKEYLDVCFPYLKEAATDENGEIWMLPFAVSSAYLLYDEEMLKKSGIKVEEISKLDGFIKVLKSLSEEDKERVGALQYHLEKEYLSRFAREESFDSKEFRKAAVILKGMEGDDVFTWHQKAVDAISRHKQEDFLCSIDSGTNYFESILANPYVNAREIPSVSEEERFGVKCSFLCVNAASDNLDAAVEYVRNLCKYLMNQDSMMMLAGKEKSFDTNVASSLYKLYQDGMVEFGIPEELYMDEWEKYKKGSVDLEQMIKETERKLKIYREEG